MPLYYAEDIVNAGLTVTVPLKKRRSFWISVEEGKHINVMDRFLSELEPGSIMMFSAVKDCPANTESALCLYRKMDRNGINLKFLKEPWLNNEIYRSVRRDCTEIDSVIRSIFRATYESIDYKKLSRTAVRY